MVDPTEDVSSVQCDSLSSASVSVAGYASETLSSVSSDALSLTSLSVSGAAVESLYAIQSDALSSSPLGVGGAALLESLYGMKSDAMCSVTLSVQGAAPTPPYVPSEIESYVYATINFIMLLFVLYLAKRAREEAEKVGGGV